MLSFVWFKCTMCRAQVKNSLQKMVLITLCLVQIKRHDHHWNRLYEMIPMNGYTYKAERNLRKPKSSENPKFRPGPEGVRFSEVSLYNHNVSIMYAYSVFMSPSLYWGTYCFCPVCLLVCLFVCAQL